MQHPARNHIPISKRFALTRVVQDSDNPIVLPANASYRTSFWPAQRNGAAIGQSLHSGCIETPLFTAAGFCPHPRNPESRQNGRIKMNEVTLRV